MGITLLEFMAEAPVRFYQQQGCVLRFLLFACQNEINKPRRSLVLKWGFLCVWYLV
jgi:hypothetical protein